uniref:Uncharacterized protein n=1 Tax=Plectus sambesii TaxID=2011161 RepID=A0A914X1E8_9BILA
MDPRNSISNNHGNKGIIIGSVSGAAKVTNNVSDGDMYINNGRPTYNYEQNINGNQTAQNGGNIQNIQGGNVNTEPNK